MNLASTLTAPVTRDPGQVALELDGDEPSYAEPEWVAMCPRDQILKPEPEPEPEPESELPPDA